MPSSNRSTILAAATLLGLGLGVTTAQASDPAPTSSTQQKTGIQVKTSNQIKLDSQKTGTQIKTSNQIKLDSQKTSNQIKLSTQQKSSSQQKVDTSGQ